MNVDARHERMRHVIVTGAASGIGRQVVSQLLAVGDRVLAIDVDGDALQSAARQLVWPAERIELQTGNVASADDWDRALARVASWPVLDALINVAGVLRVEAVGQLTAASVHAQIDVNTKGVILGTQAGAQRMIPQRRGRIINVASLAALAPVAGISVYSASKYAVRGFSLAAAEELAPHGIQVSVVYPDAVATPMVDYQLQFPGAALTFSGPRILSAEEVAAAIVSLLAGGYRAELTIPRSRGWLARIRTVLPAWMRRRIAARLVSQGLARQEALRANPRDNA